MGSVFVHDSDEPLPAPQSKAPEFPFEERKKYSRSQNVPERRKTVGLIARPDYKGSSDGFRYLSRSFEQGEFTQAILAITSNSEASLSSDTEESRSAVLKSLTRVRILESPGFGESSASFRRRSREFQKGEFSLVKRMQNQPRFESTSDNDSATNQKSRDRVPLGERRSKSVIISLHISALTPEVTTDLGTFQRFAFRSKSLTQT